MHTYIHTYWGGGGEKNRGVKGTVEVGQKLATVLLPLPDVGGNGKLLEGRKEMKEGSEGRIRNEG
jgi:hypothetical protein